MKRLLARVNRLLALEIVCSKSASRYFKPKALPTGAGAVDTANNYTGINLSPTFIAYYFTHDCIAKLMIMLEVVSAISILVSWDRLDIPEITRYIVYYSQTGNSEMVITVSGSENSVTIDNLLTNEVYQFQVVALAELDGEIIEGERSNVSASRPTAPPATTPPPISATTPASPAATEGECESEHFTILHLRSYNSCISCSCCSVCIRNGYLHCCAGGRHLDPNTVYSSTPTCGVLCLPLL